jgi:hypothetical protein
MAKFHYIETNISKISRKNKSNVNSKVLGAFYVIVLVPSINF